MSVEQSLHSHLNGGGSAELRNAVLRNVAFAGLTTAPSTPVIGETYYDLTLGRLRTWTGSEWISGDAAPTYSALYGNGLDGDVTVAANTTLTGPRYYNNLTIAEGVALDTDGYPLYVKGTLTLNNGSSIHCNGRNAATNGTAGAARSQRFYGSGTAGTNGTFGSNPGGSATLPNAAGGKGGLGGYPIQGPTTYAGSYALIYALLPSQGGPNYARLIQPCITGRTMDNNVINGGAGGSGGMGVGTSPSGSRGGGGGGGAGVCIVFAAQIVVNGSATVSANGGDGGPAAQGPSAGGGGGGGGGWCVVISQVAQPAGLSVTANGGTGGTPLGGYQGETGYSGTTAYLRHT